MPDLLRQAPSTSGNTSGLEDIHEFLEQVPNLKELVRLRSSLLRKDIIEISGRLTRDEFVEPSEIEKVNN